MGKSPQMQGELLTCDCNIKWLIMVSFFIFLLAQNLNLKNENIL